jgi:hypothetical protein
MAKAIAGSPQADAQIKAEIAAVPSIVEGSQAAEAARAEIVKPLVGAQNPAPMTLDQINVKWSAVDPNHVIKDSVFPTPQ